jgi:O-antigen polysaccharide polymerase Wzy
MVSDIEVALAIGTVTTCVIFALYVWMWRRAGQPVFAPYPIFMVSIFLYHQGQYILHLLDQKTGTHGTDHIFNLFRFNDSTLLEIQFLTLIALVGLQSGAIYSVISGANRRSRKIATALTRDSVWADALLIVGYVMVALSAYFVISDAVGLLLLRLSGGYAVLWGASGATNAKSGVGNYAFVLANAYFPACLFILAGSRLRKVHVVTSLALLGSICTLYVIAGDRSTGAVPPIAYAWLFQSLGGKLPKSLGFAAIGVILIGLPLISVLREVNLSNISPDAIIRAGQKIENPLFSLIDETGGSAITLADTYELVPTTRPLNMGTGYLTSALSPFSFVFNADFTGGYEAPAIWIVQTRYPQRVAAGAYLGFSAIGEAYLEFSWIGVFVVMAVLGYILVRILAIADSGDLRWLLALAILVLYLPHFARGSSDELGRPLFRYAFLPVMAATIVTRSRSRRRTVPRSSFSGLRPVSPADS